MAIEVGDLVVGNVGDKYVRGIVKQRNECPCRSIACNHYYILIQQAKDVMPELWNEMYFAVESTKAQIEEAKLDSRWNGQSLIIERPQEPNFD